MPRASNREIPAIRIWPMSDKIPGFKGRTIADVQARTFLRELPACEGRFRYQSAGLNTDPGTIILFQFSARIIASAVFLRDDKYEKSKRGYAGAIYLDPQSIRTFDPLDLAAMRKVWPNFRAFGHVKQFLNPTVYSKFKRTLENQRSPVS